MKLKPNSGEIRKFDKIYFEIALFEQSFLLKTLKNFFVQVNPLIVNRRKFKAGALFELYFQNKTGNKIFSSQTKCVSIFFFKLP